MRASSTRNNASAPTASPQREATVHPAAERATSFGRDLSRVPAGSLQRKLTVGAAGDVHEREADRAAASVMRKSDPGVQTHRGGGDSAPHAAAAPPLVHQVINTAGQPLDPAARTFMESRFGLPFDHVRVHTGSAAAESARSVHAGAYTVGRHVVFGHGRYAPHSTAGRELIAHELAHVVQQGDGEAGVVQRAEVDDRSCAGLTDIESDVDTKVNSELGAARTAAGTPPPLKPFIKDAVSRLAGISPIGPIEGYIEGLGAKKAAVPPASLSGTKYSGAEKVNKFYMLHTLGAVHVVGSHSLIHGICVGADKIGHFFQQGAQYFDILNKPGSSVADAQSAGRALEIGSQGLSSTGVYSNADQAANLAGAKFWADLIKDHVKYKFAIKDYITSKWNEQSNPSFYEKDIGGAVWTNLLTGAWKGPFTSAKGASAPVDSIVKLTATATDVKGTYEWPAGKPTNKGTITGKITQRTTSVTGTFPGEAAVSATPVSGITIDFEWAEGTSKGKGIWKSVDEQTLDGSWGIGSSTSDGGTWSLKKS